MARYDPERIPYPAQERLLNTLCEILCRLKTPSAVRNFLKDLLNRQERLMLVRRLQVAELLLDGKTYRAIQEHLHVGPTTIARVERWLNFGRGGYLAALKASRSKTAQRRKP